jgi:hypothetical protein
VKSLPKEMTEETKTSHPYSKSNFWSAKMNNQPSNNLRKLIILILAPGLISTALVGCGDETSYQSDQAPQVQDNPMSGRERQQEPESTPVPKPSIDPFYGNGPGGSFYGH